MEQETAMSGLIWGNIGRALECKEPDDTGKRTSAGDFLRSLGVCVQRDYLSESEYTRKIVYGAPEIDSDDEIEEYLLALLYIIINSSIVLRSPVINSTSYVTYTTHLTAIHAILSSPFLQYHLTDYCQYLLGPRIPRRQEGLFQQPGVPAVTSKYKIWM